MNRLRTKIAMKDRWQRWVTAFQVVSPSLIIFAWAVYLLQTVYPGRITGDSSEQYLLTLQGRYADWHPPIMSHVMHLLEPFGYSPGAFFLINLFALLVGAWLIVYYHQKRSLRFGLVFAMLFPLLINPLVIKMDAIIKDQGLLGAYTLAFGIGLWTWEVTSKWYRLVLSLIGVSLIFYGTALRHNAIFAALFLLAFFIQKWRFSSPWFLRAVFIVSLWLTLLAAIHVFNYTYLGAKKEHAFDYNMTSDVMAVETLANCRSDVCGIFGDKTSEAWKRYVFRPEINQIVRLSLIHRGARPDLRSQLSERWRYCLLNYPKEYLVSRIAFFMQTVHLGSSPDWFNRLLKRHYPELPMQRAEQSTAQVCRVLLYMIPIAAAVVLWIVMVYRLIFRRQAPCERSDSDMIGFFSLSIAVFYFAPYFFFAVSPSILHYYWPCVLFGAMGCLIIVWTRLPFATFCQVMAPASGGLRRRQAALVCACVVVLLVNRWVYDALCTKGDIIVISPALRGIVWEDKLTLFAKYPEIVLDGVNPFYAINVYSNDNNKKGEYKWDLGSSSRSTVPQSRYRVVRALYSRGAVFSRYWGAYSTVIKLSRGVRYIEIQQRKTLVGEGQGEAIINVCVVDVAHPVRAEKSLVSGSVAGTRLEMSVDCSTSVDGFRSYIRLKVTSDDKMPDKFFTGVHYGLTITTPHGTREVIFAQDTDVSPTLARCFSQRTLILDQVVNGSLSALGNTITKVSLVTDGGQVLLEQTLNVPIVSDPKLYRGAEGFVGKDEPYHVVLQ